MARLIVHVEGLTEERFVNEVLWEHLWEIGFMSIVPMAIGFPRHRGGSCSWAAAKKDIVRHLNGDRGVVATTMVDYYRLPQKEGSAWPGRAGAANVHVSQKGPYVQAALLDDLGRDPGARFDARRFVPFVVMHEFEGLLFSDCAAFSRGIRRPELEPELERIRSQFNSPEEINDSLETAPSKRLKRLIPDYQKPVLGILAAKAIGIDRMRAECPHFADWLRRLESAASLL